MEKKEEKPESGQVKPSGAFLNGVLLGVLLGAGAFFFLGTKEGKKSRRELLRKGRRVLTQLEEMVDDIGEKKEELIDKGKEVKEEIEERIVSLQKQVKGQEEKIKQTMSEVSKNLSELKKNASREAAKAQKRFFNKKGRLLH